MPLDASRPLPMTSGRGLSTVSEFVCLPAFRRARRTFGRRGLGHVRDGLSRQRCPQRQGVHSVGGSPGPRIVHDGQFSGEQGASSHERHAGRAGAGEMGVWTHERSGVSTAGGIGMVLSVRKCLEAGELDDRRCLKSVLVVVLAVRRGVKDGFWQRRRWPMSMKYCRRGGLLAPHRSRPAWDRLAARLTCLSPPSTPFSTPCGLLGTTQAACSS
ncbi:hypothetical protein K466DRAFT_139605 [Polyporus arcularius HHB13444]|uniref:Uncharacterized protein n=1 Tax=Polyporus arcularius HHB13444 TaxID=1314778 RepID=A0A5C3NM50_9APHY|nr:hypothetical protein K466DRAFT_139605 [Polyporus arcularius HHB13444]